MNSADCGASESRTSKQQNEQRRTSEWTSKWASTYIWILGCSGPLCFALSTPRALALLRHPSLEYDSIHTLRLWLAIFLLPIFPTPLTQRAPTILPTAAILHSSCFSHRQFPFARLPTSSNTPLPLSCHCGFCRNLITKRISL